METLAGLLFVCAILVVAYLKSEKNRRDKDNKP